MNKKNKSKIKNIGQIISLITSGVISVIITSIGIKIVQEFEEKKIIGWLIILLGFLLTYFFYYISTIKQNKDDINELKDRTKNIEEKIKNKERLLNNIEQVITEDFIRRIKK